MKPRNVRVSDAAATDILGQAEWYEHRAGPTLAVRWERAVNSAIVRILDHPRSGSLCNFKSSELQQIRRMPIDKFAKHLVFYQLHEDEIVILRVLHGARDLESLF